MRDEPPVLWHLKVSHYNEKVRWALDYKRVPHVRRAVMPGGHPDLARRLSGGSTLPVLVMNGDAIGDSTRIIEALERLHPEPPLYPPDPADRRRALAAEEFYDEELGEYIRRLVVHHMLPDADLMLGAFFPDLTPARRRALKAAFPLVRRRMKAAIGVNERSVAAAFDKVRAAGERFRADVGRDRHLVAGRFSVADLTLAALLAPVVAPDEFPYPQPQRGHPLFASLRGELERFGLVDWTREMYARYRGRSAAIE